VKTETRKIVPSDYCFEYGNGFKIQQCNADRVCELVQTNINSFILPVSNALLLLLHFNLSTFIKQGARKECARLQGPLPPPSN
jgi:hypothetical protein